MKPKLHPYKIPNCIFQNCFILFQFPVIHSFVCSTIKYLLNAFDGLVITQGTGDTKLGKTNICVPQQCNQDSIIIKTNMFFGCLSGDKLGLLKGKPIIGIFHSYYFCYGKIRSVKANTCQVYKYQEMALVSKGTVS